MCQDKKIWRKFVKNVIPINIGITRTFIYNAKKVFPKVLRKDFFLQKPSAEEKNILKKSLEGSKIEIL